MITYLRRQLLLPSSYLVSHLAQEFSKFCFFILAYFFSVKVFKIIPWTINLYLFIICRFRLRHSMQHVSFLTFFSLSVFCLYIRLASLRLLCHYLYFSIFLFYTLFWIVAWGDLFDSLSGISYCCQFCRIFSTTATYRDRALIWACIGYIM